MARPTTTFIDLAGRTFGLWYVLRPAGAVGPTGAHLWRCRCTGCGTEKDVRGDLLRRGSTTRCRACHGRALAARQAATGGHTGPGGRLYQRIWPRACATCGAEFLGTARQKYCRAQCRKRPRNSP